MFRSLLKRSIDDGIRDGVMVSYREACPGSDDPDNRCPKKPRDCVCTSTDMTSEQVLDALLDLRITNAIEERAKTND